MKEFKEITFQLPYPPSINHYYKKNKFGGLYVGKKGRDYRELVAGIIKQLTRGKTKIIGSTKIEIDLYPPDKRKRDIDNVLKCLLDALQDSGIIQNDNQIYSLTITRLDAILDMVEVKLIY